MKTYNGKLAYSFMHADFRGDENDHNNNNNLRKL
jgi:hypothetical protein